LHKQIIKKLESLENDFEPRLEKLISFNYHKVRTGDYRAIVVLDYKLKLIEVRRARHRKKIYKNLR
jgi:mRNA-degrading endonuclease RelE of RelBE toxin-antitoxin system